MAPKSGFSFGFTKKAEPKRVVEALKKETIETKELIKDLNGGEVTLEAPCEQRGLLTIACKNPLLDITEAKAPKLEAKAPKVVHLTAPLKEDPITKLGTKDADSLDAQKLGSDDAEAVRELMLDAQAQAIGEEREKKYVKVEPILMRAGSRRARDADKSKIPDASKDQFDRVPVESFGEALLRGMGYDPAQHTTKPIVRDKQRDNLLGLGAKPMTPAEKAIALMKAGKATPAAKAVAAAAAASASGAKDTDASAEKRRRVGDDGSSTKKVDDEPPKAPMEPNLCWPSRGLVVRVIAKSGEAQELFGLEAVVLEADEKAGCCRVKARVDGKSRTVDGVPVGQLETRVSRDCKEVRVVRGTHRGKVAQLVKRDVQRGLAHVDLNGASVEMSLDDVCQFMA